MPPKRRYALPLCIKARTHAPTSQVLLDLLCTLAATGKGLCSSRQVHPLTQSWAGIVPHGRGLTVGMPLRCWWQLCGSWILVQAGAAYDRAELVKHGSAAKLNFPRENYAEDVKQLAGGPYCHTDQACFAWQDRSPFQVDCEEQLTSGSTRLSGMTQLIQPMDGGLSSYGHIRAQ